MKVPKSLPYSSLISMHFHYSYCVGTVLAMLLNFILPEDAKVEDTKEIEEEKPEKFADDEA